MNQSIDLQRSIRDEAIFVRQNAQLKVVPSERQQYGTLLKHHRMLLDRERLNCLEINALRVALADAKLTADKWRKRCEEIQNTTI